MPHTGNVLVIAIPVTAVAAAIAVYYVFPRKKSRRGNSGREVDVKRESVNGALKELEAYGQALHLLPRNFLLKPAPGPKSQSVDKVKALASEEGWVVRAFGETGARTLVNSASSFLEVVLAPLDWLSDAGGPTLNPQAQEEKERERVTSSMESRRLAEARERACSSAYYASISEEAERLKSLKEKKDKKDKSPPAPAPEAAPDGDAPPPPPQAAPLNIPDSVRARVELQKKQEDRRRVWSDPDFERGDAAIFANPLAKQGQLREAVSGFTLNWLPPQLLCSKGKGRAEEGGTWLWAEEGGDAARQPAPPTTGDKATAQVTWYAATAVAAAVQHTPYMSDQLIDTAYEQQGIYGVSLKANNGGWMMVHVDSYLPCYRLPSTPASSRHRMLFGEGEASMHEIWTAIVEKAIAKAEGCYEAIQGTAGVGVVLERLLGYSSTSIPVGTPSSSSSSSAAAKAEDALFKTLRARVADPSNLLLACSRPSSSSCSSSSSSSSSPLDLSLQGLAPAQCFTVLGAEEHGGVRLLQLRRPTGPATWVGAWSRDSELWNTPEGKAIASKVEGSSTANSFFISIQDFIKLFVSVESVTCRLSSNDLRRRAHLLSLFRDAPHLLKPGLTSRQLTISAKVKADRVAEELLAEEEKKQKKGKAGKRKVAKLVNVLRATR